MQIITIILGVIANFIVFLSFGSLLLKRGKGETKISTAVLVGFFAYYSLFFVAAIPVMKMYRPLSMLCWIWAPITITVTIASAIFCNKFWSETASKIWEKIKAHPWIFISILIIVGLQIFIVTSSYNFTLDASYYVAGVATNVETNMINVYDPFTGAWQDHFEMRYFFATYPVSDAVWCYITGIPALVWTKSIMAVVTIILTNMIYYMIAEELFAGKSKARVLMLFFIMLMNLMFVTIYTSSLFLFTRTYEGKAIVGNLSIMAILYMFILYVKGRQPKRFWLLLFLICFGSTTVSSSANMLIPVEMTVFFIPEILSNKKFKDIIPYALCILPGLILALTFVAYVKGYFVFYTYPVW